MYNRHIDLGYLHEDKSFARHIPRLARILFIIGLVFAGGYFTARRVGDSHSDFVLPAHEIARLSAAHAARNHQHGDGLALVLSETQTDAAGNTSRFNTEIPRVADLVALIDEYPNAEIIAANIWRFPMQLVDLAIRNHETIDFVADFLIYGRNINVDHTTIDISGDVIPGEIPHFMQWDKRWGYSYYGGANTAEVMALVGCGPVTLSMIIVGLTGNLEYNPRQVADFAQRNGFITPSNDTTWTLMSVGALEYGLAVREIMRDAGAIRAALNQGEPIITSMGPGDFTTGGHFIAITSVNPDGTVNVLDANSFVNSEQSWDLQRIMPQMRNIWAFRLAD